MQEDSKGTDRDAVGRQGGVGDRWEPGIGAAIAKRLAHAGAAVAITYVSSADKAKAVAKEIAAEGGLALVIRADSADPAAVVGAVADHMPAPGMTLYTAAKAALVGLTKGLARDLGPRGIRVTVVHPGMIDTDMNPADAPGADANAALAALGTYGTADDVAATVAHLAGEGGRYITGTAISVDGGFAA